MGSTFNPLILIEKLVKLNSSQQSIETLSHWCIFHMNKAKYVVETWDKQFHSSPREQRLAFLYLANDILQNSRRKGSEFVGEFWKVLPDALRDVLDNGNEFDKNSAQRLINIWEERKVFGSRGQLLKEELVSGRNLEIFNKDESPPGFKLRNSAGNAMDKIVSSYQVLSGGQLDEETIMHKCRNAIRCIEKVDKNISSDIRSEELIGYDIVEEIRGQQATLISCIKQLTAMESCRTNLVSNLTEALREQEFKLNHVRHQLQVAESQSEHAENLCKQILNKTVHLPSERPKVGHTTEPPQSFMAGIGEQTAPLVYIQEAFYSDKSGQLEDNSKSAVAAVPSELTAITSSAQIPTYVLSDGVIVNSVKEPSDNYPPGKKPKLENDHPLYSQSQKVQPPVPHPNSLQHHVTMTSGELIPLEQPPLPSSPPPMPPLPPLPPMNQYPVPQFMQNAVPVPVLPYGYGSIQQQPRPLLFPAIGTPFNANLNFLAPPGIPFQNYPNEGGFYGPQPSLPTAPASRQF